MGGDKCHGAGLDHKPAPVRLPDCGRSRATGPDRAKSTALIAARSSCPPVMPSTVSNVSFADNRLTFCRRGGCGQVSLWPGLEARSWRFDGTPVAALPELPAGCLRIRKNRDGWEPLQFEFEELVAVAQTRQPSQGRKLERIVRRRAAQSFAASIPSAVRAAVAPFYRGHVGLLQILAGGQAAAFQQLLATNPGLALALAHAHLFVRSLTPESRLPWIAGMVFRPRPEIATALGFPARSVGTLARIEPAGCSPRRLVRLRKVLGEARTATTLSHLPRITGSLLEAIVSAPLLWSPALLAKLASQPASRARRCVTQLRWLQRQWRAGYARTAGLVARIRDLDSLEGWVQRCRKAMWLRGLEERGGEIASVPPPLPGTEAIQPLARFEDFLREDREMEHCLLSPPYFRRLFRGRSYYYRTVAPLDRATVEVRVIGYPNDRPLVQLAQIYGPAAQREVSDATLARVYDWLRPFTVDALTGAAERPPPVDLPAVLAAARAPLTVPPALPEKLPWPSPPRPAYGGTADINALTLPGEFLAEAGETETCAHLLLPAVGLVHVYRVLESANTERATLVLEQGAGPWGEVTVRLVALYGRRGAPVSEETRRKVSAWLRDLELAPQWPDYDDYYLADEPPDEDDDEGEPDPF